MRPTTDEDICFLLESEDVNYKEKEMRRGRGKGDEGGMQAEKGEQLSLVGATRPADVSRQ